MVGWACWRTGAPLLRDILTSVPSEDFVNQGLISDAAPACFLAELFEDSGIDSDRDQLARLVAERTAGRRAASPSAAPRMNRACRRSQSVAAYAARSRRLARRALIIRIASASPLLLNVYATMSTRPLRDRPSRITLVSPAKPSTVTSRKRDGCLETRALTAVATVP